jgi:Transglycosylase
MQIPSKYYKIAAVIFLSFLILLAIGGSIAYSKREALLKAAIKKAVTKAKNDYNLDIKIKSARFAGLRTVEFEDVSIVPHERDSLLRIQHLRVGVKLFPLIFGDIKLAEVKMNNAKISLIKKDSTSNYDFLFRKKNSNTPEKYSKVNLAELANNLLNQLFYKIPDDMDIRNMDIRFTDDNNLIDLYTTQATIDGGDVESTIKVNGNQSVWHVQGEVDPGDKQLNLMLFADGKKVELPYIEQKFGLKLNFDTVSTEMKRVKRSGDEFKISGSWVVKNLLINHPRIAANDIIVPDGSMDADMLIGENFIAIDSTSTIHLKNIEAHPFIRYTLRPQKIYELKLHSDQLDAQELINAFPQGLFESLEGIQLAGKLQYDLNFYLDTRQPDNVVFDSRLNKNGFKILKWGKTNLQKINNPFVYTPYESGKPMRDIIIGPQNANYTPINQISPYLKNALLTAEDPSFYNHKGFVEESIRKAIATNFKEKAYKRGGSTISMQLVKNVYLSRQKTLARKIEEILIVWMIENARLSSKKRMFEAYLNLIEWGRNVYGIGEASRYYFGKQPSQLDLGESLFLTSIVPRPKSGLYFFENDGSLRGSLHGYFKLIGNLMAKRGMVPADSSAYGFYSVRLKGSLRRPTAPVDSAAIDDLTDEEDPENSEGILQQIFGKKRVDTVQVKDLNKPRVLPRDTVSILPEKRRRETGSKTDDH